VLREGASQCKVLSNSIIYVSSSPQKLEITSFSFFLKGAACNQNYSKLSLERVVFSSATKVDDRTVGDDVTSWWEEGGAVKDVLVTAAWWHRPLLVFRNSC
jgi:hypothetical protein